MPKFCTTELLPRDLFRFMTLFLQFLLLNCTCLNNVAGCTLAALFKMLPYLTGLVNDDSRCLNFICIVRHEANACASSSILTIMRVWRLCNILSISNKYLSCQYSKHTCANKDGTALDASYPNLPSFVKRVGSRIQKSQYSLMTKHIKAFGCTSHSCTHQLMTL